MYIEMFAKSADFGSHGKTTWLNTGNRPPSIALSRAKAPHLGNPRWHITLEARDQREKGTGDRGGGPWSTDYKVMVELTPADVATLVGLALEKRLLDVVVRRRARKRN
jgi:hypothetical protein